MLKPKNRLVIQRMGGKKIIQDFHARREAMCAFYDACDKRGCTYGNPIFEAINGLKAHTGQMAGDDNYKIVLYI